MQVQSDEWVSGNQVAKALGTTKIKIRKATKLGLLIQGRHYRPGERGSRRPSYNTAMIRVIWPTLSSMVKLAETIGPKAFRKQLDSGDISYGQFVHAIEQSSLQPRRASPPSGTTPTGATSQENNDES